MSTSLMGLCWPLQMPPTPKAVLISLADQANDQGVCWPAIGSICKRTCLSERAVQNAIKWLQESGGLVLRREAGRATTYQINPESFGKGTADLFTAPARRAPPHDVHPRTRGTTPPHHVHPTPAGDAGDPRTTCTQNHKEPSVKRQRTIKGANPAFFDEFWKAYPRRTGIDDARRAFAKRNVDRALLDVMVAAIKAQGLEVRCKAGEWQFVPHPATWLNQGRWQDEVPGVESNGQPGEWWETQAGAEKKAEELGLPKWDQCCQFRDYVARIKRALGEKEAQPA